MQIAQILMELILANVQVDTLVMESLTAQVLVLKLVVQFTFVKHATFVNIICNNILFHFLLLHHLFDNFVDINECTKSPSLCHSNANCSNTDGSYSCLCLTGYSGDGRVDCIGTVLLRNYFIVMFPSLIFIEITAWEVQCVIFLFMYDFK